MESKICLGYILLCLLYQVSTNKGADIHDSNFEDRLMKLESAVGQLKKNEQELTGKVDSLEEQIKFLEMQDAQKVGQIQSLEETIKTLNETKKNFLGQDVLRTCHELWRMRETVDSEYEVDPDAEVQPSVLQKNITILWQTVKSKQPFSFNDMDDGLKDNDCCQNLTIEINIMKADIINIMGVVGHNAQTITENAHSINDNAQSINDNMFYIVENQLQIQTDRMQTDNNTNNVDTNSHDINTNKNNIDTNTNNIDNNKNDTDINTNNIDTNTNNIDTNTNNIDTNIYNIDTNTNNIDNNTNNIDNNTNNIDNNKNDIDINTNNIDTNIYNIDTNTNNIVINTNNIDTIKNDIDTSINNIDNNKNNIDNNINNIDTNTNNINTNRNNIDINRHDIATNLETIETLSNLHISQCGYRYVWYSGRLGKITYTSLVTDVNSLNRGGLDIETGVFTAPIDGTYLVNFHFNTADAYDGQFRVDPYKNDRQLGHFNSWTHNKDSSGNSFSIELKTNDKLHLQIMYNDDRISFITFCVTLVT